MRALNRISPTKFAKEKTPGRYCDGGGLYLLIGNEGARSWVYRFQLNGKARDMGLGSADIIGLADARQFAGQCRALVARKIDPIEERGRRARQAAQDARNALTFRQCAEEFIEAKRPSWKSAKHAQQCENTLVQYVYGIIGDLSVAEIDTGHVLRILKQEIAPTLRPRLLSDGQNGSEQSTARPSADTFWLKYNETAGRVRSRIENVLDFAKARGARQGDNPARWQGHLENLLAKPSEVQQPQHHPALPYLEIAAFMAELRTHDAMAAQALEFLILTAVRTCEVLGAKWDEIDFDLGIWTIPAERMKGRKKGGSVHRVPLSEPALALLKRLAKAKLGSYIFPGLRRGKPLSNMAMLKLLERMGRKGLVTAHGFRATFREWAAERTNVAREVAELALSHNVKGKAEEAYWRGDILESAPN